ncbi:hypothetical protein MFFDBJGM_01122 [Pectobacterium versatile]|nr:hypothetical protein PB16LOC_00825 [Pectobacterium versatile]GBO48113.1 hypothetical protein MFFDBJGM_01122 [Pectobacterium versatile]GKW06682.1 hypothetical protein PEC301889_11650 [Pectobacterium carotovorum subsp. carotovorum]
MLLAMQQDTSRNHRNGAKFSLMWVNLLQSWSIPVILQVACTLAALSHPNHLLE